MGFSISSSLAVVQYLPVRERWSRIRNNRYVLAIEWCVGLFGGLGLTLVGAGLLIASFVTGLLGRELALIGIGFITIGGWLMKLFLARSAAPEGQVIESDPAEDVETFRQLRESWRHRG
jgi:hypothetical protein